MMTKEQIDRMSYRDKVELCRILLKDIKREKIRMDGASFRGKILMSYMMRTLGWDRLPSKSRESQFVWARSMVAVQLLSEGYSLTQVGAVMDKGNSAVINMRRKMQDAFDLPEAYRDILELWNRFQQNIKKYDTDKRRNRDTIEVGEKLPSCD